MVWTCGDMLSARNELYIIYCVKKWQSVLWREISVKIMVYCLNLLMVYTLHSGGVEIPFWCGHWFHFGVDTDSTLVWTLIPLWCGHSFHFGVDTHSTLVWTLIPLWCGHSFHFGIYIVVWCARYSCVVYMYSSPCGVQQWTLFTVVCSLVLYTVRHRRRKMFWLGGGDIFLKQQKCDFLEEQCLHAIPSTILQWSSLCK